MDEENHHSKTLWGGNVARKAQRQVFLFLFLHKKTLQQKPR